MRSSSDGKTGRRTTGRRLAARAASLVLLLALAFVTGLLWFAGQIPDSSADDGRPTDGVVVLTGGSARIDEGLALMAGGRAQRLLVSGVFPGVTLAELMQHSAYTEADVSCCVDLGYNADDTAGNAVETTDWMRRNGFRSITLVTAAYHMPRSLLELRRAMPDAVIVPHPVYPQGFRHDDWWYRSNSAALLVSEYAKFLFAWVRGLPDMLLREAAGSA